ncbi:MAG: PEP-CTERM sorting domain-containing protein [Candidatus Auribacterota bacterium]
MKIKGILITAVMAVCVFLTVTINAATITLGNADRYVHSIRQSGTNYASNMTISSYYSYVGVITRAFAEFSLQSLYSQGITASSIVSATFVLGDIMGTQGSSSYNFYAMNDNEDGTYLSGEFDAAVAPITENNQYGTSTQDVTAYLKADLTANKTHSGYSLRVATEYSDQLYTNWTANPVINITYTEAPPVPEPATILLIISAIAGFAARKK